MTCLCLTRNRRQWLPQAIRCYQEQTYSNRELLILADGDDVRDLVPPDESIRYLQLSGAAQIGDKRNLGCSRAAGEIIAHWDDDDYSAPGRLADQVERLLASAKACTGYHTMRFTDGKAWWIYEGTPVTAIGTSLCYRRGWWTTHPFHAIQIGEDNLFAAGAAAAGQLSVVEAGDLMHATIHPGNTSPRNLHGHPWKSICA